MNRGPRAVHCVPSTSKVLSSPSIWISDALLEDSFNHFARSSRRHGSHVPGPLEARRRAAKRRNTSLAYVGRGTPATEASVLRGKGSTQGWWVDVRPPTEKTGTTTSLSSWLGLSYIAPPPPLPQPLIPELEPNPTQTENHPLIPSSKAQTSLLSDQSSGNIYRHIKNERLGPAEDSNNVHGQFTSLGSKKMRRNVQKLPTHRINAAKSPDFGTAKTNFCRNLRRVNTLEKMRRLIKRQAVDLTQEPMYSEIIFAYMLRNSWSQESVGAFLEDPILNHPGTRNAVLIMQKLCSGHYTLPLKSDFLLNAICTAISLGLVSSSHVRYILEHLSDVHVAGEGDGLKLEGNRLHLSYFKVIESIKISCAVTLEDLGREFWSNFTARVSKEPFGLWKARLLSALRSSVPDLELDHLKKVLLDGLRSIMYDQAGASAATAQRRADLFRFIQELQTIALAQLIFCTTEALIVAVRDGSSKPEILKLWQEILLRLDAKTVNSLYDLKPGIPQEPPSSLDPAERLLALSWTLSCVGRSSEVFDRLLDCVGLRTQFEHTFKQDKNSASQDFLAQILETLQQLPLPDKALLLARLQRITDNHFIVRCNPSHVEGAARSLHDYEFSRFADDNFYRTTSQNLHDLLREVAEAVNGDLSTFLNISRMLIATDKSTFTIITRILSHNLPLKMALSQSSPQRLRPLHELESERQSAGDFSFIELHGGQKTDTQVAATFKRTPDSTILEQPRVVPQSALRLINHLAISFATTTAVDNNSAFRKVYWCYLFLHRNGAPIQPPITRALWHAGVTRYQEVGASVTKFKWVLTKVREVEGDKVARMLLWSAGYRQRRKNDIESLGHSNAPRVRREEACKLEIKKLEQASHPKRPKASSTFLAACVVSAEQCAKGTPEAWHDTKLGVPSRRWRDI